MRQGNERVNGILWVWGVGEGTKAEGSKWLKPGEKLAKSNLEHHH